MLIALDSPLRRVFKKGYELGYNSANPARGIGRPRTARPRAHILIEELSWGAVDLALEPAMRELSFHGGGSKRQSATLRRIRETLPQRSIGRDDRLLAITEPHHGSDTLIVGTPISHNPPSMDRSLRVANGDHYVITGQKAAWVSQRHPGAHAALYCTTEPVQGMAGGGIAFVPLDLSGVSKGQPLNKLGQRALKSGEIFFDGVRIPRHYIADGRARIRGLIWRAP